MELCGHQRGDSRLRFVLSEAGRLMGLSENLMSKVVPPNRSTIVRRRWHLDSAIALLVTDLFRKLSLHCDTNNFMVFHLSDSSPRVGTEWLLTEVFVLTDSGCERFLR